MRILNRKHFDRVQPSIIESQECVRPNHLGIPPLPLRSVTSDFVNVLYVMPQSDKAVTLFHLASLIPWT